MDNTAYLRLRNVMGIMGCFLPFLCILGASFSPNTQYSDWWTSISVTYYSSPVLIAVLSAVSFFLIIYKGYDLWDTIITTGAGLCGFLVVFFPCECSWVDPSERVGLFWIPGYITKWIHYPAAAMLFFLLAINSIFLFSKSSNKNKNILYRICGYIILCDLVIFGANAFFFHVKWTIIVNETIMLLAFGLSWIVKGHMLDRIFGD